MLDEYYTPSSFASGMLNAVPANLRPRTIADFSAGGGSLLLAAASVWPKAKIVANDISKSTSSLLRRHNTSWQVSSADFLSHSSSRLASYNVLQGSVDLILMNPPFSERGRKLQRYALMGEEIVSGTAVAFLVRSLTFLSKKGCVIAVLPNSCFTSQRDRAAWNMIRSMYSVELVCVNERNLFAGVTASTSVVRVARLPITQTVSTSSLAQSSTGPTGYLQRGTLQMHSKELHLNVRGLPLVHSSDLRAGKVEISSDNRYEWHRIFNGPGVLFPRVGRVTTDKICILPEGISVVLSDCVFGVATSSNKMSRTLKDEIHQRWDTFISLYNGTGAPYITLASAESIMHECLSSAFQITHPSPPSKAA